MMEKDKAFQALIMRRFEHAGRQQALEESKSAHIALDNFLIQIEAGTEEEQEPEQLQREEQSPQGKRRAVALSSPLSSPCAVKRPRLAEDATRRVSFDSAVALRGEVETRPEQSFNRKSTTYVPGRNAPKEGVEYLDTSGLGTTAARFFGVRKKGKAWVETKEGQEMDEQWEKEDMEEVDAREPADDQSPEDVGPDHDVTDGLEERKTENEEKTISPQPIVKSTERDSENDDQGQSTQKCGPREDTCSLTKESRTPGRESNFQSERGGDETGQSATANSKSVNADTNTQPVTNSSHTRDGRDTFTYGMGWSSKHSPNSRPKGVSWKPGIEISLSRAEMTELVNRGRTDLRV